MKNFFYLLFSAVFTLMLIACGNQNGLPEMSFSEDSLESIQERQSNFYQPEQRADSTLFVITDHDYSHFLFRKDDKGQLRRTFVLGVYTDLLHPRYFDTWDTRHNRIPDKELFDELTRDFNLIYTRFTYINPEQGVNRPAYYDSLGNDKAFVMGAGHLPWWLRTNYSTGESGVLSCEDQLSLHERVDRPAFRRQLEEISRFAGESPLIINLVDEPERGGYGDSWSFSGDMLRLMYKEASPFGLVSLGLGPVGFANGNGQGNKLLWSLDNYDGGCFEEGERPDDATILRRTNRNTAEVLDGMMNHYAGSYDLLYLNSYALQISNPAATGATVSGMLHHPTVNRQKPVYPWISTENFRYDPDEKGFSTIRRQVFSALANEAGGILFYPDVRVDRGNRPGEYDERLWQFTLELAEELNEWRDVLETGEVIGMENGNQNGVEWIRYKNEDYDVLFLANHRNQTIRLESIHDEKQTEQLRHPIQISARKSGIWYRPVGESDFRFFE